MALVSRESPTLSVVIGVLNARDYIMGCLESLYAQDLPQAAFEVLVVDGGSTDDTVERVGSFVRGTGVENLRVLHNPRRILAAAFNVAIPVCRGRFVAKLDAQGRLGPRYYSSLLPELQGDGQIGLIGGSFMAEGDTPLSKAWAPLFQDPVTDRAGEVYRYAQARSKVDAAVYGIYRKAALEAVGPFDERILHAEDTDFNLRLMRLGWTIMMEPGVGATYSTSVGVSGLRSVRSTGTLSGVRSFAESTGFRSVFGRSCPFLAGRSDGREPERVAPPTQQILLAACHIRRSRGCPGCFSASQQESLALAQWLGPLSRPARGLRHRDHPGVAKATGLDANGRERVTSSSSSSLLSHLSVHRRFAIRARCEQRADQLITPPSGPGWRVGWYHFLLAPEVVFGITRDESCVALGGLPWVGWPSASSTTSFFVRRAGCDASCQCRLVQTSVQVYLVVRVAKG